MNKRSYALFRQRLHDLLQEKTSWGRNDLLGRIDQLLVDLADEEVDELQAKLRELQDKTDGAQRVDPLAGSPAKQANDIVNAAVSGGSPPWEDQ